MEITRDNLDEYTAISQELTHIPLSLSGKLYIGGRVALNTYKNYNIDHIITLFKFNNKIQDVKHEIYDIIDYDKEEFVQQLNDCLDQITSSIHQSLMDGKNVCVHCKGGISRSSTVLIEYLIKYQNMGSEALDYVKKYRPIICPNPGFYRLLKQRNPNF
jgi:hypothetical protein